MEEKTTFSQKTDINGTLNRVFLIGNIGSDIELKTLPKSGFSFASFNLATNKGYKDQSGQMVVETQWTKVDVFGKQAETLAANGKKGSKVFVEGSIETRNVDDKYYTSVKMSKFQFLTSLRSEEKVSVGDDPKFPGCEKEAAGADYDDFPF